MRIGDYLRRETAGKRVLHYGDHVRTAEGRRGEIRGFWDDKNEHAIIRMADTGHRVLARTETLLPDDYHEETA
jgi:hypothetical protein